MDEHMSKIVLKTVVYKNMQKFFEHKLRMADYWDCYDMLFKVKNDCIKKKVRKNWKFEKRIKSRLSPRKGILPMS